MKKYLPILALAALFLVGCLRTGFNNGCDQSNPPYDDYGPPTYTDFKLSSYGTGRSATHTMTFDITECHRETYQAIIKYPGEFTFNGFLALGPAGTQIGNKNSGTNQRIVYVSRSRAFRLTTAS